MTANFQEETLNFGHVQEMDGQSVVILALKLDCEFKGAEYTAELGTFINLSAPQSNIIAVISGVRVIQTLVSMGTEDQEPRYEDKKIVTATMVGYLRSGTTFERGIERYPTIGTKAFLLSDEAATEMFEGLVTNGLPIGERCQRGGGIEYAHVDKLFGRHTAVIGTTGSGKSWTVASLLQSAMSEMPQTRFLFLDLHDEYRAAFPTELRLKGNNESDEFRQIRHISSSEFKLPYWCLNAEELEELFVSQEHVAQNQSALFKDEVRNLRIAKAEDLGIETEALSVDTPVYFSFEELTKRFEDLNEEMVPGAKEGTTKQGPNFGKLHNLVMRLKARKSDPRYGFLFPEGDSIDHMEHLLSAMLGYDDEKHTQMTVLDLSGLPSDVLSVIVGVIGRLAFEYKYWDTDPHLLPLTIVLEEAHNYLPNSDYARHRICLERIQQIAKEGRKYGLNLVVISQRPSELNETVLSQCANFIALRLTNPADQSYVRKLLPDFLAMSVDMLPYLRTGEAVFVGEAVELPARVKVTKPNPVPKSNDVSYLKGWKEGLPEEYSVAKVIERWRKRER